MSRLLLAVLCGAGCAGPPAGRLPTTVEVSPEAVLANYAPPRMRVFADRGSTGAGRYVVIASEMPDLVATWRPLVVIDRRPPPGHLPRAGDLAWVAGHVIAGEPGALLVYDRDGRKAERVPLRPAGACTAEAPPLLQADGDRLHGVLRCPREGRSHVFTTDGAGVVLRMEEEALVAELYAHGADGDYLVGGGALVRHGGRRARAAVPAGPAEVRELLLGEREVVLVDGGAGRLWRFDRETLRPAGEGRFPARGVVRLRAALAGDHVLAVLARGRQAGTELFGLRLPLGGGRAGPPLLLGTGPAPSDHEVVPVSGAAEVLGLLVRTHQGNTGPLVALSKLAF